MLPCLQYSLLVLRQAASLLLDRPRQIHPRYVPAMGLRESRMGFTQADQAGCTSRRGRERRAGRKLLDRHHLVHRRFCGLDQRRAGAQNPRPSKLRGDLRTLFALLSTLLLIDVGTRILFRSSSSSPTFSPLVADIRIEGTLFSPYLESSVGLPLVLMVGTGRLWLR